MKVINRRGRVLLEVTGATAEGVDSKGLFGVLYHYQGVGCGGSVPLEHLHKRIEFTIANHPSGKVVGVLPEPKIGFGVRSEKEAYEKERRKER